MTRSASLFTTFATALALMACGGSDSTDPDNGGGNGGGGNGGGGDNGAEPAAIAVVSGSGQSAKTQEAVAQAFVVAVTDADGAVVSGATVAWSVIDGPGSVFPTSSTTNAQGQASSTYTGGTTLGTSTVRASVSGLSETADFTVETSTLVIRMQNTAFVGPNGSDDVTVPLGATIEWQNRDAVQHTATSTAEPTGGSPFDSNLLSNGGGFSFTPSVEGTWTYFCEVHPTLMAGATITVTAASGSAEGSGSDDSPAGPGDPGYDPGG
ncbi:MAG TPA: Ig-like domain-containing protein [Gemmatimonadota bacterium]|nr:Ig-like domain-containing protein [Gemmatimonadota bacterium]